MKHKVTLYVKFQFDPIILIVDSFAWKDNGDLMLYGESEYWRIPYNSLNFVYIHGGKY